MQDKQSTLDFRQIPQETLFEWFRDHIIGLPLNYEQEDMTIADRVAKLQYLIERDQQRHVEAERRAEALLNGLTTGILTMEMPGSGLGGPEHSLELYDLLEYLAGVVQYGHPPCYGHHDPGHPQLRLTLPQGWHASLPGSMVEILATAASA